MSGKGGFIYILTNKNHGVLYIGVTSDLLARIIEHKSHRHPHSFTSRYSINKLVYYETFGNIEEAIAREKYLKGKKRGFKEALIKELNPEWRDLFEDLV